MNLANFRELGGIENRDGKKVKHYRLLRSGEIYKIDDKSRETLKEFQLVKVLDLRGEAEREKRPDDHLPNVDFQWIDIMKEVHDDGSLDDLATIGSPDIVDQHMMGIYDKLILNNGAQEGYQEYFEELLKTEEGSVLFHCFAGKDRTGIAAALTLELLDVPKDKIYEDYLATNVMRQKPNEKFYAMMKERGMEDAQLESFRIALEVRGAYLDRAYQLIEENFGDVPAYAREVLRLSPTDIRMLKALYLED